MILSTSLRPHELTVETDIIAIGEITFEIHTHFCSFDDLKIMV
jgi:hypothetical protein